MIQLRTVMANLVRLYLIEFVDADDGKDILENSRDCFTTNTGGLDVRLTPRSKI